MKGLRLVTAESARGTARKWCSKGRRLTTGGRFVALARVRGADQLGNAAVVSHTVTLRDSHR